MGCINSKPVRLDEQKPSSNGGDDGARGEDGVVGPKSSAAQVLSAAAALSEDAPTPCHDVVAEAQSTTYNDGTEIASAIAAAASDGLKTTGETDASSLNGPVRKIDDEQEKTGGPSVKTNAPGQPLPQVCDIIKKTNRSEFITNDPNGLYLIYEPAHSGTFLLKFSKDFVDNALAFARPGQYVNIPEFKYRKATVLQTSTNLGRTNYFSAWSKWLKEVHVIKGTLVLLNVDPAFPAMSIYFLEGEKVTKLGKNPKSLRFVTAAAVVPENFMGLEAYVTGGALLTKQRFKNTALGPPEKALVEFTK